MRGGGADKKQVFQAGISCLGLDIWMDGGVGRWGDDSLKFFFFLKQ